MCTVSMIMDHYREKWTQPPYWPYHPGGTAPPTKDVEFDPAQLAQIFQPKPPAITAAEIEEFRALLERAREYDKRNNEPDCELDEKRQAVKAIAKQLGVEISFL